VGEVVEREQIAVLGGDHELAFFARERPHRSDVGVHQSFEEFGKNGFPEPCSPDMTSNGYGPQERSVAISHVMTSTRSLWFAIEERYQRLD
jgi:hypothetical protein